MTFHFLTRDLQTNLSAALRPRSDRQPSTYDLGTFAHGNQSDSPLHFLRDEARAVILHFKLQRVPRVFQANPSVARSGVAGYIIQRFLQHAVDVYAGARFDRKRLAALFVMQPDARLPSYRGNIPVQSAL